MMKKSVMKKVLSYVAVALAGIMIGSAAVLTTNPMAKADNDPPVVVTSPFTAAIAEVHDSVVGISNYQNVRYSNYDPFGYSFFFGGYANPAPRSNEAQEVLASTGSGTVIGNGYVLTNYHVVEDAARLTVTVVDQNGETTEYDAKVVNYDANVDVAVLYAEKLPLKPVQLGDSDQLAVGDWTICIGNPLNATFTGTVTVGIVSGLNRNISSSTVDKYGRREIITNTMIQTDAAINNGNSGGGMFNTNGELMGIPTMKYTGSVYSGKVVDNIGMCIPINAVKPIIEDALAGMNNEPEQKNDNAGSASDDLIGKPRMGITIANINTNSSAVMSGSLPNGVYVSEVEAGAPADAAGMQAGDIIVDVNDNVITSVTQLQSIVSDHRDGDTLNVKVYRVPGLADLEDNAAIPDGEYIDLQVTITVVDAVKQ